MTLLLVERYIGDLSDGFPRLSKVKFSDSTVVEYIEILLWIITLA